MKTKRIKAVKTNLYLDGSKPVDCYVLRQSDVRALAEQLHRDYWHPLTDRTSFLDCLKRAGITPGRARKGTQ